MSREVWCFLCFLKSIINSFVLKTFSVLFSEHQRGSFSTSALYFVSSPYSIQPWGEPVWVWRRGGGRFSQIVDVVWWIILSRCRWGWGPRVFYSSLLPVQTKNGKYWAKKRRPHRQLTTFDLLGLLSCHLPPLVGVSGHRKEKRTTFTHLEKCYDLSFEWWQKLEEAMSRVWWVLQNVCCFPAAPGDVKMFQGGKGTTNCSLTSMSTFC